MAALFTADTLNGNLKSGPNSHTQGREQQGGANTRKHENASKGEGI